MSKTIFVSNRLPVRIGPSGTPERTTGGLASALEAIETEGEKLWIGWTGLPSEEVEDQDQLTSKLRKLRIEPVHLSQEQVDGYYEGYSNATLWPLLHGMTQRAEFLDSHANIYREVNQAFAEVILASCGDEDLIWIHDYHLFLLPAILREARPTLRIGFFLHTPFPSSDIFRTLPERDDILLGLLGADLIGFHTYNYLRHFRSSLLRVLGVETEHDSLYWKGQKHQLGVYPIGHNRKGFAEAMQSPEFTSSYTELKKDLEGKKLVLNVERLDYTKGIPQKLGAIRHFLENNPAERDRVTFVIIAVPSRESVDQYADLTHLVQQQVGAINGDYGSMKNTPVNFLHRGFPPAELAAFYCLADICLVSPLIDGMNLVAKEFIDCKSNDPEQRPGTLILSEFAGAAAEMSQAMLVNPYAVSEVSEAIAEALQSPAADQLKHIETMQRHLVKNDAESWASNFISYFDTLERPSTQGEELHRVQSEIAQAARDGKKISLFLDYDGTLRNFTKRPNDAVPDAELIPLLERLSAKADISIVSGRPMDFLSEHFGGHGFNLVAEHGYRWSRVGKPDWELTNPHVDVAWKELVMPQLEQITQLTPGTHIEEKPSALVWHYRAADPEFGSWQATRLLAELTELSASLPVAVHHGKKIVEIASLQVSKGLAVEALVRQLGTQVGLAAGDDQTDESMFSLGLDLEQYHTIHIGDAHSRATHITGIGRFRSFLEDLADLLHS